MGIIQNLVIKQGETSKTPLVYRHGVRLVEPLTANIQAPPTEIKVSPLTKDIPSGYLLTFEIAACQKITLTTASIAIEGSESIQIQPYTGTKNIACGKTTVALPIDLTGEVWRGQCRRKITDLTPAFSWDFTLTPLQGLVVGTVPADVTAALVISDRERVTFSDIPDNFQLKENFNPAVYAKAWVYDWERVKANGDIERAVDGLLWLVAEVTR